MVGSKTETIIGRPILPDVAVHAVVEKHELDAKVIIFKKKRRKNYRRTKWHRHELTKLRITDIQGVEKPVETTAGMKKKANVKEPEKVANLWLLLKKFCKQVVSDCKLWYIPTIAINDLKSVGGDIDIGVAGAALTHSWLLRMCRNQKLKMTRS